LTGQSISGAAPRREGIRGFVDSGAIRGEAAAPTESKRFPVLPWLDELLFSLIVLGG